MSESNAGTGGARSTVENVTPQWLINLKDNADRGERPRDKPQGRWLGDFLNQATESGLLPTELQLLDACAKGERTALFLESYPRPSPQKSRTPPTQLSYRRWRLLHDRRRVPR
jgi:hypothetical protein